MKWIFIILVMIISFLTGVHASNVSIDGNVFDGAKLINSVTYVPLRKFTEVMSGYEVGWNGTKKSATVSGTGFMLNACIGDSYIECNDRYIYSGNENLLIDGSTFVPIRSIAKTFGAKVEWDNATRTAHVMRNAEVFKSADDFYNGNDLYWLAKIINAESEGEPLQGKIAVGNVVMNRVRSSEFPNNIYDVIFDKKGGVQFTPVANGSINKYPNEESFMAAKICLENYKLSDKNILFFLNPTISTSTWVPDNRDYVMTIGRHEFYA